MGIEIGIRIPPCAPVAELLALVQLMEDGGVDRVGFADSQLLWRDVWATVGAAAVTTSRIKLAVAVTNPVTRHATVTASASRTLAEMAPDRFSVCVGVGDSSVSTLGVLRAGHTALGEYVATVRSLLHGEDVSSGSRRWHLKAPSVVPVLVAAVGPRNLTLAGRVGDGVITGGANWPRDRAIVRDAALAADRDPDLLTYAVARLCVVTDDPARDAAIFKPMCTRMVQLSGTALFDAAGVQVKVPPPEADLGDLGHPDDWNEAVAICDRWISDEAAMWFGTTRALFGSAADVVDGIRALESAGVDQLHIAHPGSFTIPSKLTTDIVEKVLPLLR